jgi:DNA processing protein
MSTLRHLTPDDPDYPPRLRALPTPPLHVTVRGSLAPAKSVAIVGTRLPVPAALVLARELARAVASRGGVVVSGGAVGIDAAAHEGALEGSGRTWVVAGTGHGPLYPKENAPLFERVITGGGAMVWPFAPGTPGHPSRFLQRNGVLVALADVLVIIQARIPSGALNAGSWARRLKRPRWVVCPPAWAADDPDFAGCQVERRLGARALTSVDFFLDAIGMPNTMGPSAPPKPRNTAETRVLAALSAAPKHVDEVVSACGLPYPEAMTALLTLALDDVLVEGPEGFYRQVSPP